MKLWNREEAEKLIKEAVRARENSYAPYSSFSVGAALLSESGKIYRGCNIENAAFTPGNCAERTAFFCALSNGERSFCSIAVVGGRIGEPIQSFCAPCGVCRQVMAEFCDPKTFLIYETDGKEIRVYSLEELFPDSFGPKNLQG